MWQEQIPTNEIQEILRSFRYLLESCFGPRGGVKIIVSGGGYLTVTSSSSQLIRNLPFSNPIISFLLNFIKSQQNTFQDYGLYVGIISSFLIEQSWIHGRMSSCKALKFICEHCLDLLELGSIKIDLSSVSQLLAATKSLLSSKPSCSLTNSERQHLSILLVKGFLSNIGDEAETQGLGRVLTVTHCGLGTEASELLKGILYPYPEEEPLTLELCQKSYPWHILLYTCMLDSTSVAKQQADHLAVTSNLRLCNALVSHFATLVPQLISAGIRLVACQKVVHPEITVTLRRAGIVVLHRLGTQLAQSLQRISGAAAMDAPTSTEWQQCIGILDTVVPITRHNKMYLQLSKHGTDISTLLLCISFSKSADEIEILVRQTLASLSQLLIQPKLVPGAGCFESWLAWKLRNDIQLNAYYNQSKADIDAALSWVERSLLNITRISAGVQASWELASDSVAHHAWIEDSSACLCGSLTRISMSHATWTELSLPSTPCASTHITWTPTEDSVVDVYRCKANALRHAFDACLASIAVNAIVHT